MSGTVSGILSVDLRADHHLSVIRHQTRRIQFDLRTFDRRDHPPRKCLEVLRLGQQRRVLMASVEQVIKTIRLVRPWQSSPAPAPLPQHKNRTLPIPPHWYLTPFLSPAEPNETCSRSWLALGKEGLDFLLKFHAAAQSPGPTLRNRLVA